MINLELSAYDATVEVNGAAMRHVIGASLTTQWLLFPHDARHLAFWLSLDLYPGEMALTICGITLALYHHRRAQREP